jgi:hypothetical protein
MPKWTCSTYNCAFQLNAPAKRPFNAAGYLDPKCPECKIPLQYTDDVCAQPVAASVQANFVIGRSAGAVAADPTFAALCQSATPAEPFKQRIEHIRSSGPQGAGAAELVHNILCSHDTQASNNCTVWYSWNGTVLTIWGLGSHAGGSGAGNRKYTMTWCDGTSKKWTRPS